MPGLFITFEGTEGAGKSTLIRSLSEALTQQGYSVKSTREPGGSALAEKIRALILNESMDPWSELFLYEAARAEHLAQTLRPALKRAEIVLCDRYADSSLAYQGAARGLPWSQVKAANRLAIQGMKPDLTVLLDIDPIVGWKRAQDRNRFEDEGAEFQIKVRNGFLKALREDPKRWFRLKVEKQSPEELTLKLLAVIQKRFKKKLLKISKNPSGKTDGKS